MFVAVVLCWLDENYGTHGQGSYDIFTVRLGIMEQSSEVGYLYDDDRIILCTKLAIL